MNNSLKNVLRAEYWKMLKQQACTKNKTDKKTAGCMKSYGVTMIMIKVYMLQIYHRYIRELFSGNKREKAIRNKSI